MGLKVTKQIKVYDIDPVPKPRMTRQDSWPKPPPKYRGKEWPRPAVKKYRDFENLVIANKVHLPEDGAHVIFRIAMPRTWSKKKKKEMNGRLHKQTPDVSNLLKALEDAAQACRETFYKDDSEISDIRITKVWDYEGKIIIDAPGEI